MLEESNLEGPFEFLSTFNLSQKLFHVCFTFLFLCSVDTARRKPILTQSEEISPPFISSFFSFLFFSFALLTHPYTPWAGCARCLRRPFPPSFRPRSGCGSPLSFGRMGRAAVAEWKHNNFIHNNFLSRKQWNALAKSSDVTGRPKWRRHSMKRHLLGRVIVLLFSNKRTISNECPISVSNP